MMKKIVVAFLVVAACVVSYFFVVKYNEEHHIPADFMKDAIMLGIKHQNNDAQTQYGKLVKNKEIKLSKIHEYKCREIQRTKYKCDAKVELQNLKGFYERNVSLVIIKEKEKMFATSSISGLN